MKTSTKKLLLALVSAGLMLGVAPAKATTLMNNWQLDLSSIGGELITNIDHLDMAGKSTVVQQIAGGTAVGQSFTDNGVLRLAGWTPEAGFGDPDDLIAGPLGTYKRMYLTFTNLTGVLLANGSIKFDPLSGSIKLWLDKDTDLNPLTGTVLQIAEFAVVAPSGGSDLNFFGGGGANATVDVTLKMLSSIGGLFKDSLGVAIDPNWTLELVNTDSLLQSEVNNVNQFGNGTAIIKVTNAGQFNLAQIPEPGTLALAGIGLLGLFSFMRRKLS